MDYRDLNNLDEEQERLREMYNLGGIDTVGKKIDVAIKETSVISKELSEEYRNLASQLSASVISLDNYCNIAYTYNVDYVEIYYQATEPSFDGLEVGTLWYNTSLNIPYVLVANPIRFKEVEDLSHNRAIANSNLATQDKRTFYIKKVPTSPVSGDFYLDNNRRLFEYKNGQWILAINYIDSAFSQTVYEALEKFKTEDFHNATHLINPETGTIESITEHITRNNTEINSIKQDMQGIVLSQESLVDYTEGQLGINKVLIENAHEAEMLEMKLEANKDLQGHLFPSNTIYPSNDLYPNKGGMH